MFTAGKSTRSFRLLSVGLAALALAGCAGSNADGDPGPTALSAGETCQSIRADLIKLDKSGVERYIEQQNAGKKLTPEQKAQADLYNRLLNQYLGARCHV